MLTIPIAIIVVVLIAVALNKDTGDVILAGFIAAVISFVVVAIIAGNSGLKLRCVDKVRLESVSLSRDEFIVNVEIGRESKAVYHFKVKNKDEYMQIAGPLFVTLNDEYEYPYYEKLKEEICIWLLPIDTPRHIIHVPRNIVFKRMTKR